MWYCSLEDNYVNYETVYHTTPPQILAKAVEVEKETRDTRVKFAKISTILTTKLLRDDPTDPAGADWRKCGRDYFDRNAVLLLNNDAYEMIFVTTEEMWKQEYTRKYMEENPDCELLKTPESAGLSVEQSKLRDRLSEMAEVAFQCHSMSITTDIGWCFGAFLTEDSSEKTFSTIRTRWITMMSIRGRKDTYEGINLLIQSIELSIAMYKRMIQHGCIIDFLTALKEYCTSVHPEHYLLAIAMGTHPRLGNSSHMRAIPPECLEMVVSHALE